MAPRPTTEQAVQLTTLEGRELLYSSGQVSGPGIEGLDRTSRLVVAEPGHVMIKLSTKNIHAWKKSAHDRDRVAVLWGYHSATFKWWEETPSIAKTSNA